MNQPTDNLPAEYATIRASLKMCQKECGVIFAIVPTSSSGQAAQRAALSVPDAIAALDRLAAREVPACKLCAGTGVVDAGNWHHNCPECTTPAATDAIDWQAMPMGTINRGEATQPAPPAAECAARRRLERLIGAILLREPELRGGSQAALVSIICKAREFQHSLATPCQHGSEIARLRAVPGVLVAGRMERSLADHERACLVLLEDEQRKIAPDNALISTLCESVRMVREYCDSWKSGHGITADFREELACSREKSNALAAELAQARKATEEAQSERDKWLRLLQERTLDKERISGDNEDLAAELRRAVDALRLFAWQSNMRDHRLAREIIVAYDAKHGKACNIE